MLGFETRTELDVSRLVFGEDDLARVVGQGTTSYGDGFWEMTFLALTPKLTPVSFDVIGGCASIRSGTAKQGFATMSEWLREQIEQHAGLKFAYAEDRNHERPADEQPYFLAGLYLIDKR
jgi:hypothetical protein